MSLVDTLTEVSNTRDLADFSVMLIEDEWLRDPQNIKLFLSLNASNWQGSKFGVEGDIKSLEVKRIRFPKSPILNCFLGRLYTLHPCESLDSDFKQIIEDDKMTELRSFVGDEDLQMKYNEIFSRSSESYLELNNKLRAIESFRISVDNSQQNYMSFSRLINPTVDAFLSQNALSYCDREKWDGYFPASFLCKSLEEAKQRFSGYRF